MVRYLYALLYSSVHPSDACSVQCSSESIIEYLRCQSELIFGNTDEHFIFCPIYKHIQVHKAAASISNSVAAGKKIVHVICSFIGNMHND